MDDLLTVMSFYVMTITWSSVIGWSPVTFLLGSSIKTTEGVGIGYVMFEANFTLFELRDLLANPIPKSHASVGIQLVISSKKMLYPTWHGLCSSGNDLNFLQEHWH